MAQFHQRGFSTWLRHRLTMIGYTEDRSTALAVLRCAAYDAHPRLRLRLRDEQEKPLGAPPLKWAISGPFDAPLHAAAHFVQGLALHLAALPLVLIQLATPGLWRHGAPVPIQPPGHGEPGATAANTVTHEQQQFLVTGVAA